MWYTYSNKYTFSFSSSGGGGNRLAGFCSVNELMNEIQARKVEGEMMVIL